ncbi:MAG: 3-hydroxyacyl-CoA dehydrogenase family protein [Calditrichota bacterium]
MSSSQVNLEPEFYPIERLLIVGPLMDAKPPADRATAAGHNVTLLLPDDEIEHAPKATAVLGSGDAITADDFDIVLELHCTNLEAKAEALYYLEDALAEAVPIISLTMAIATGELVREMLIPERVIGVSMLPPFEDSKLAELMPTPHTSRETIHGAKRLFESLGLDVRQVSDSPGGVLVRTVCCLVNEAALALQEQIATPEAIDKAMQMGGHLPFGPLAWGDRIGLDRVLAVMEGLFAEFKDERYRPAPLLKQHVRAGFVGIRSARGFHSY